MALGITRLQLLVWGRGMANTLPMGQTFHFYGLVLLGKCNFISLLSSGTNPA